MHLLMALLLAMGPGTDAAAADPASAYRQAAALYQAGAWEDAARRFEPLARSTGLIASYARFALGNVRFREAAAPELSAESANPLLFEAIALYRQVLDEPLPAGLSAADVRHNLELAKRRLHWPDPAPNPKPTRQDQSNAAKGEESERPEGAPVEKDERARPGKRAGKMAKSAKEEGDVLRPAPGLGFHDVGPLTPDQAQARLAAALRRIEAEQKERLKIEETRRPRLPGDY